jgi:hypothetical protein
MTMAGQGGGPDLKDRSTVGRLVVLTAFGPCLLLLGGCFGPTTVRQTRDRYNEAIRETNDEELLLNLVRLRYNEHPSFLPITSLNAQFELNASADYRGGPERGALDNFGTGQLSYSDRPTLTFAPQRPPQLTKALLTQVDLDTLYLFARQESNLERVLRLFVRTMNGIDNANSGGGPVPRDPPAFGEFRMVSELMQRVDGLGISVLTTEPRVADLTDTVPVAAVDASDLVAIKKAGYGVRLSGPGSAYQLTETKPTRMLVVHPQAIAAPELQELAGMLRLRLYQTSYEVEAAPEGQLRLTPWDEPRTKLTITTRSILEVMYLLSKTVAVPEEHCRQGLVRFTRNPDGSPFDWGQVSGDLFHVCVAKHKPRSAFVAVKYRGYWYYIEDSDISSKTTLNLFNELLRLQKIGAVEGQPVLTLPLGP